MKTLIENWKRYLKEEPLAEAKVYSMGDHYAIAFHPDNIIYITKRGMKKKKWVLKNADDESYKHLRDVFLRADPFQVEVTRDELLRGRYGKITVITHRTPEDTEEELPDSLDDLDFNF